MFRKPLLTIAMAILVGFTYAQSLRFERDGVLLENNEKIIYEGTLNYQGEMVLEMKLHNTTDTDLDAMVEKAPVQEVEGTENSFCWGQCFDPSVMVSFRPTTIPANTSSDEGMLSFHYQVDPTYSNDPDQCLPGTTIVKYYAYPADNTDDRVCLEVWFAYNATDVAENTISFGKAYPNPASSEVRFDLRNGANASVTAVVYNLLGQEVKTTVANNGQDNIAIDVADMQPGIYFCSFFVNNEVLKTEKFIVKH